jgi:hypothetical protein
MLLCTYFLSWHGLSHFPVAELVIVHVVLPVDALAFDPSFVRNLVERNVVVTHAHDVHVVIIANILILTTGS